MVKIYKCNLCKFKTGSRRRIRKHVKKAHQIKGQKPYMGLRSPVSMAYRREEIV